MKTAMQRCAKWLGIGALIALALSGAGFAAGQWLLSGDTASRVSDVAGGLLAAAAALGVLTAAAWSLKRIYSKPGHKKRRRW